MGVRDSIRAYNGVIQVINQYDIGKPKRKTHRAQEEFLNGILHKFAKDNDIKGMAKNNSPRYKGSYIPVMSSCCVVQENWTTFKVWLKDNYDKKI